MIEKATAPRIAASGSVVAQAPRILAIVRQFARRVTAPTPNNAPQLTYVVDTGNPNGLAAMTMIAVIRLAVNPWP